MFEDFRDQLSKLGSIDAETILYKLASTYCDVGTIDAAIDTLQMSARTLRYRFSAAAKLGRLYRKRGMLNCAADWLQQAGRGSSADNGSGAGHRLRVGRDVREAGPGEACARGVLHAAGADADYRDVRQRIDRLSQTPAGS